MTPSAFPSLLRAALARAGLRHSDLARKVGISRTYITGATTGKLPPPLDRLERMADVLDLTGRERDAFMVEAWLAHTPAPLAKRYRALERDSRRRR